MNWTERERRALARAIAKEIRAARLAKKFTQEEAAIAMYGAPHRASWSYLESGHSVPTPDTLARIDAAMGTDLKSKYGDLWGKAPARKIHCKPLDWRDVRRMRLELGLTQGEAARAMGTSGAYLSHWEEPRSKTIAPKSAEAIGRLAKLHAKLYQSEAIPAADGTPQMCPHCGSRYAVVAAVKDYQVLCLDCGLAGPKEKDRKEAISQWNKINLKPIQK